MNISIFPASIAALLLITACTQNDPWEGRDFITRSADPNYQYNENGKVAATACHQGARASYSTTGSGCMVDSVFARQAANPRDLVDPRAPGPGASYPAARAAYEYTYGTSPEQRRDFDSTRPGSLTSIPASEEASSGAESGGGGGDESPVQF